MPFPPALSLSHRAELSAAPPLPVRSCSRHEASPQLLCSGLSKSSNISCSSHTLPSKTLHHLCSPPLDANSFTPLHSITQTCTQGWRWGHTHRVELDYPSPCPVAVLSLGHPRAQLALCVASARLQNPPDPFSLGCSLASCTLFCTNIHGCSIPGVLSGTCSYQTSYDLRLPNSPILSRPFCKVPLSSREFYTNAFFSPKDYIPNQRELQLPFTSQHFIYL